MWNRNKVLLPEGLQGISLKKPSDKVRELSVDLNQLNKEETLSQTKPWSSNSRGAEGNSSNFRYSALKTPPNGSVKPELSSTV